ncbi:MAG: hypothetical protein GY862_23960 [Gammaproteobacteria bacterium]|nr:hypothetical protein [Gammaproteobacteria bacterium]
MQEPCFVTAGIVGLIAYLTGIYAVLLHSYLKKKKSRAPAIIQSWNGLDEKKAEEDKKASFYPPEVYNRSRRR